MNRQEATAVEKIVTMFLSYDVKPQQIGVVTPYEGQRAQVCTPSRDTITLDVCTAMFYGFMWLIRILPTASVRCCSDV